MKKITFIAVFIFLIGISVNYAFSERGYYRGNGPCYSDTRYLSEELSLTEEQQKQIEQINKDFDDKFYESRGNRDQMWKLHEDHQKAIEKVLTAEQLEQFKKLEPYGKRGYGHRRGRGRGRRGFGPRGEGRCW